MEASRAFIVWYARKFLHSQRTYNYAHYDLIVLLTNMRDLASQDAATEWHGEPLDSNPQQCYHTSLSNLLGAGGERLLIIPLKLINDLSVIRIAPSNLHASASESMNDLFGRIEADLARKVPLME